MLGPKQLKAEIEKRETLCRNFAQHLLDVIVANMSDDGYPVELTNKADHRPDFIPAHHFGNWRGDFDGQLSRALVGAWSSKAALVNLTRLLIEKSRNNDFCL